MRILFILLQTFGDMVMANSLVETVKNYYGEGCEITVICNRQWKDLIARNPHVSQVIANEEYSKNLSEVHKMIMSDEYDEVLMPQQLNGEDNMWHQFPETREQHLFDFYLNRCRIPADSEKIVREVKFYADPNDKCEVEIPEGIEQVWAFHTTSRNPFKDISSEQWQKIIAYFSVRKIHFVQIGHGEDMAPYELKSPSQTIGKSLYTDMRGKLTFSQIYNFLKEKCSAFIGLDSGMSFLAASTGIPTFTIYGCTIPLTSGPWGENVHPFVSPECKVAKDRNWRCHNQCDAKPDCIKLLQTENVVRYIEERTSEGVTA